VSSGVFWDRQMSSNIFCFCPIFWHMSSKFHLVCRQKKTLEDSVVSKRPLSFSWFWSLKILEDAERRWKIVSSTVVRHLQNFWNCSFGKSQRDMSSIVFSCLLLSSESDDLQRYGTITIFFKKKSEDTGRHQKIWRHSEDTLKIEKARSGSLT